MDPVTAGTLRDWALVAVSLFNTVLLLWLGLSLWLHADRRNLSAVLSSGGFLLGSLFFISHSALLLSKSWEFTRSNTLWLSVAMIPVLVLPFVWYVVLLHHARWGTAGGAAIWRRHRPWLLLASLILALGFGGLVLLGIPHIPGINRLTGFIWPLRQAIKFPIAGIPLVAIAYPLYVLLCVTLSVDTLRAPDAGAVRRGTRGAMRGELRDEMHGTLRRSRRHLFAATVVLLAIGILVATAVVWTITNTREGGYYVLRTDDVNVIAGFDLTIALLIGLVVVLLGQAMTKYDLFMGKALPRRELARQWRRAIALAAGYGVLLGGALVWGLEPVYAVLLTAGLMTVFFVLLSWRASVEWQQAMRQLRPMVTSQGWYKQLTASPAAERAGAPGGPANNAPGGPANNAPGGPANNAPGGPANNAPGYDPASHADPLLRGPAHDATRAFAALCRDVLAAPLAYLVPAGPLAAFVEPVAHPPGRALPSAAWTPPAGASPHRLAWPVDPLAHGGATWGVPLWSERGLAGVLLLGPREDDSLYSEEELEIGRAAGERLIDTAAGMALSQRLIELQREQMTATQLLDQRTRRVLHDEVLPLIHTAMLSLPPGAASETAVTRLSEAHGQVSALLRDLPVSTTPDVARLGPIAALRRAVEGEFGAAFGTVDWACDEAAERAAAALPSVKAEALYWAARELVRNAARHAQPAGGVARHLRVRATCEDGQLVVAVQDNGDAAGIAAAPGHGLALHTTLMAIAGGALTVQTLPTGGTRGEVSIGCA